jgi:phospholipid/cholesterol/gamma-HCH transport system substrate-binding protein
LDKESQQQLKGSLSNVRAITDQLDASVRGNLRDLDVILGNLSQASDALRKLAGSQKQEDLAAITQDAKSAAASLKGASLKLDSSLVVLQGVLAKADSGQGTLGKLLNDRALYDHLDELVRHADEFVQDWKKNPKKYVNLEVF